MRRTAKNPPKKGARSKADRNGSVGCGFLLPISSFRLCCRLFSACFFLSQRGRVVCFIGSHLRSAMQCMYLTSLRLYATLRSTYLWF